MFINQVDHHYHIHYKAHQNKHPSFLVLAQKNLIIEKLLYTPKYCALTQVGTAQKMKFSIKDFFSECDQIRSFLRGSAGSELKKNKCTSVLCYDWTFFSHKN